MSSSTEQVLQTEQRLTKITALLAFTFSLGLSVLLIVISQGDVKRTPVNDLLAYFLAGGFAVIGSLYQFWSPLTPRKLAIYFISYSILGALLSSLILGYDSSIIYPSWIILFFAAYIFFGKKAFLIYAAFLSGAVIWLVVNFSRFSFEEIIVVIASSVFMALLFSLMVVVWQIADKRADRLEEAKKAEEVGRKQLTALIDSMRDAVIAIDNKGVVQVHNAATLNLLDVNQSPRGKSIQEMIKVTSSDQKPVDIMKLLDSNKPHKIYRDLYYHLEDGDNLILSMNIAPIRLGFPEVGAVGYSLIISDITKAKSLDDQRQEFISVASHELRTPLAAAEGNLSLALLPQFGPLSDKAKEAIDKAYKNISQLSRIVTDLTTLSESERGLLDVELSLVDPSRILKELLDNNEGMAKSKNLKIITEVAPDTRPIQTSYFRVMEILDNFVANAIEYTDNGGIDVRASMAGENLRFSVQDTGIGIAKADRSKIFEEFYRSEDFHTRKTGGTGLGLYIAKKLADRIHAKISFDSHLNHGSTFYLDVPTYRQTDQLDQDQTPQSV